MTEAEARSSSSRPRASGAGSPTGRTCSMRPARSASTSTRCAAGGASAAAARSWSSEGEFAKHGITSRADHLTPFSEPETRYRERRGLAPERRLGCHARVRGDLVVDVPPESQVHRQVVRKEADAHPIELDPSSGCTTSRCASPISPTPRRPAAPARGARARLAAHRARRATRTSCRRCSRRSARATGRPPSRCTTARTITAIWPGFHDVALGVAFDVGSTTVAGHLCDLHTGEVLASAGAMNPQIRFGEDLMSRVSLRDDAPGLRGRAHGAPSGSASTTCSASCARRPAPSPTDVLELTARRQPDHAPPGPRARPDRAGRRAVRARDRRGRAPLGRATSICTSRTRAPASTCCRASPATSAPTRPG